MITLILNFAKNHWLGAVIGAFAMGIAAKLAFQRMEITHLRSRLDLCNAENITLVDSNQALVSSIDNQNAAISALRAESQKKIKIAERALTHAKSDAGKYALAAEALKTQANPGDECAAMRTLVNNYMQETQ